MNQKFWWIIIAVLVLVVAVVWMVKLGSALPPVEDENGVTPDVMMEEETVPALGDDTTGEINEELQGIDIGDLEAEFQTIDEELEGL